MPCAGTLIVCLCRRGSQAPDGAKSSALWEHSAVKLVAVRWVKILVRASDQIASPEQVLTSMAGGSSGLQLLDATYT